MKEFIRITWKNIVEDKITFILYLVGLIIAIAICMSVGLWIHEKVNYANAVVH